MISKKWLYIAIGVVVLLGIAWYVSTKMMWGGISVDFQQNADGTQTYSNEEGSVTTGPGATMPSSWPADAPANYSGAQIIFSGNSNPQTGKAGAVVSYSVQNVMPEDIASYYRQTLAAKGWKIAGDAYVGTQIILGATKDTRTFAISISEYNNNVVTVTAGMELQ